MFKDDALFIANKNVVYLVTAPICCDCEKRHYENLNKPKSISRTLRQRMLLLSSTPRLGVDPRLPGVWPLNSSMADCNDNLANNGHRNSIQILNQYL